MPNILDTLAHLDSYTAWLRVCCYLIVGAVMTWRFVSDLSWPYFRLGLAIFFGVAAITGFAVATRNTYIVAVLRTLQTPVVVWLAVTSVHYMHRARRHRQAITLFPVGRAR